MNIYTITFHKSLNYGARLQTYALQQALIALGYDSRVIDYSMFEPRLYQKIDIKKPADALKKCYMNFTTLVHKKKLRRLKEKFDEFTTKNILLTGRYNTYEELKKNPPKADVYLSGSDQVWNITYRHRPEFFMEFAPKGVRRASYAASIGSYNYSSQQLNTFRDAMQGIAPVSVREGQGRDFLLNNFGIKSYVHVDPVFLLDEQGWKKVAAPIDTDGGYILCYPLTRNPQMQSAMDDLKKKTGLRIVVLTNNSIKLAKGDKYVFDAGPAEFISWIMNANYVFTTSFHGTALSIMFKKSFGNYTLNAYASRTDALLSLLHLENRKNAKAETMINEMIDYSAVNTIIEHERKSAYEYLKEIGNICDR